MRILENYIHKVSQFETVQEENGNKYNAVMFTIRPKCAEDLFYDMPSRNGEWAYTSAKEKGLIVGETKFLKSERNALCLLAFVENEETTVFGVPVPFLETIVPDVFANGNPNYLQEIYEKAKRESVICGEYTIPNIVQPIKR